MAMEAICRSIHPDSRSARRGVIGGEIALVALGTFGLYRLLGRPVSKFKRLGVFALSGAGILMGDTVARNARWGYVHRRLAEHDEKVSKPKARALVEGARKMPLYGHSEEITALFQRNTVQHIGDKIVKNPAPAFLLNEVAAYEMAQIVGLTDAIPPSRVRNHEHPFVQDFIPNTQTVQQLYTKFASAFDRDWGFRSEMEVLSKGFDLASLQKCILLQVALGTGDAHFGNVLAQSQSGNGLLRLWSIDHEDMMPDSNHSRSAERPIVAEGEAKPMRIPDVASLNIPLAGLPQANQPFQREVLESVTMDVGQLSAWHKSHGWYSEGAVAAQQERVEKIAGLVREELQKARITLTPRRLVEMFVEGHSTYDPKLVPFFRLQKAGKASGLHTLYTSVAMTYAELTQANGGRKGFSEYPEWVQNLPDFAPTMVNRGLAGFPRIDQAFRQRAPALAQ